MQKSKLFKRELLATSMSLHEWLIHYVKMRNQAIENDTPTSIITNSNGIRRHYFLLEDLSTLPPFTKEPQIIVTHNRKKVVQQLSASWEAVKNHPRLQIIFVNLDGWEYWSLFPATHDKITEAGVLESGLLTLAEEAGLKE